MQLKLVTAPDPVLSKRAKEVEEVTDTEQQELKQMLSLMHQEDGIGLAANQVGLLKRMIVLDLSPIEENDEVSYPLYMINPVITNFSDEKCIQEEGCLSLPNQQIEVERPENIKVEYLDFHGKKISLKADKWLARAIMHEMDHLDGKLLVDYVSKLKKDLIIKKIIKFKKQQA